MFKVMKRECPVFGDGPYVCEFLCDTASDVTMLPTSTSEGTGGKSAYDNQKCASGSIATVVDNGAESKRYMLNNHDIWCPNDIGTGGSYELPIATTDTLGGVMVDGTSITADEQGVISAVGGSYELPVASTDVLGGVMVDGTSITADEQGVISAVGGSGGGLELIGEYYPSSSTTVISKADYKEGDIYFILARYNSNYDWAHCIYVLPKLPTESQSKSLNWVAATVSNEHSLPNIYLDTSGLYIQQRYYFKFYKMKVG